MADKLLTIAEVAERWRVSKMTVYRLVHSGALRSIQIGHSYRIPVGAVFEYEEKH
jgi:excisionase family DNA binding protein